MLTVTHLIISPEIFTSKLNSYTDWFSQLSKHNEVVMPIPKSYIFTHFPVLSLFSVKHRSNPVPEPWPSQGPSPWRLNETIALGKRCWLHPRWFMVLLFLHRLFFWPSDPFWFPQNHHSLGFPPSVQRWCFKLGNVIRWGRNLKSENKGSISI